MFQHLWGFQSKTFGQYKSHTTSYTVCLYSLQVPVTFHFLFFSGFTVYADGAVLYYQLYLGFGRRVLQICHPSVKQYLLHIPLHFFLTRFISIDAYSSAHVISHEHRKGLCSATCTSYRTGIQDADILRTIIILSKVNPVNTFNGCCHHTFCKHCHRYTDSSFYGFFPVIEFSDSTHSHIPAKGKGSFLTGHGCFKFPDMLSYALYTDKVLYPVSQIFGKRYLYKGFWITTPFSGFVGYVHLLFQPCIKPAEVLPHRVACNYLSHSGKPQIVHVKKITRIVYSNTLNHTTI